MTYGIDAGDLQDKYDQVLTAPEDLKSQQSLDYIFQVFKNKDLMSISLSLISLFIFSSNSACSVIAL